MDNENKELNENELTPEEKVQEDISEKISEAADEISEEINEANGIEFDAPEADAEGVEENDVPIADDVHEVDLDEMPEELPPPEPPKVCMKKSNFIISIIAAAVIGALITFICFKAPSLVAMIPEGSTVASVGNEDITDLDLNYYIFAEASNYAAQNSIGQDGLASYDWNADIGNGVKLADKIKQDALDAAVTERLLIVKGAEKGITMSDEDISQADTQVSSMLSSYGEDGFVLRARTMGISSVKQYKKMYLKIIAAQNVQQDLESNPSKYYPEDKSVLNSYTQDDKASVKHILIKVNEGDNADEKKAEAQGILDRIKAGEDFDALMSQLNQDEGEPADGYSFTKGEMVEEFEKAAFALKIDEVSELVQTDYGFHIIKRVPGVYELQKYWLEDGSVKYSVNESKLAKLSVSDIMNDVMAATEELQAQSAAKSGSAK